MPALLLIFVVIGFADNVVGAHLRDDPRGIAVGRPKAASSGAGVGLRHNRTSRAVSRSMRGGAPGVLGVRPNRFDNQV